MEKYHADHVNGNAPDYCPLGLVFVDFWVLYTYITVRKILPVVACTLY